MVITSVAGIGLFGGVIGVPIGIALHDYVLPVMGHAAGTTIPAADVAGYHLPVLVPLILGGLVIATAGALFPQAGPPGPAPRPLSGPNNGHPLAKPCSRAL